MPVTPRPMRLARPTIDSARRGFLQWALRLVGGVAVAPALASTATCGNGDDDTTDTDGTSGTDGTDRADGADGTGDTGSTTTDGDSTGTGAAETTGTDTADAIQTGDTGDVGETGDATQTGVTGDTETGGDTEPDTGATETTETETGTETGTDTELGPDADGNPPPPAGSIKYGPIDRLPAPGALKGYAGQPYFVGVEAAAGAGGGAYTMTSKCTHQLCNMNGSNGRISAAGVSCRCHGAKFDLNGAGVSGPYRGPLQHYRMYRYAGDLYVNPAEPVAADVRLAL